MAVKTGIQVRFAEVQKAARIPHASQGRTNQLPSNRWSEDFPAFVHALFRFGHQQPRLG